MNPKDKRILQCLVMAIVAAAIILARQAWGGDITRGETFTDGQRLTAAELHNLVDNSTINATFFTGKPAASSLAGGDSLLLYSSSGTELEKISGNALIYQNYALITGQSEDTAPATNDFLLSYDTSAASFKKVSVFNLIGNNTNVITGLPTVTNLLASALVPVVNSGTNGKATVSTILSLFTYTNTFTNLPGYFTPHTNDALLIWDAGNNLNKQITLSNLIANLPPCSLTPTDSFQILNWNTPTSRILAQTTPNAFTNLFPRPSKFASIQYTLAAGVVANTNHGLAGKPQHCQWVLVCTTNDAGHVVGDEVDVQDFYNSSSGKPQFASGGNATNVFLALFSTSMQIRSKLDGAETNVTAVRWQAKNYSTYFP